jgi:hypothetical protein
MRRLAAVVTSMFAVAVPAAYACYCGGCPPSSCGTSSEAIPGSGLLFVHSSGQRGPLDVYGARYGHARFSLPAGILSANGSRFLAGQPKGSGTSYRLFDARDGHVLATWSRTRRPTVAGVSANGRIAALLRTTRQSTYVELVTTATGRSISTVTLRGYFDVDAVANDGRHLFLVQWLRTGGYLIRSYDVAERRLAARPLTEDGEPMDGNAWTSVSTPNGTRVLTLYVRANGDAEVHSLDLVHGTAVCIDLPHGSMIADWQYALALGRDGRTLFATNPALGVVAHIDLRARRVTQIVRFDRDRDAARYEASVAAASAKARTVYFSAGDELYAYDVLRTRVRGPYPAGKRVTGLAFDDTGNRLLVLRGNAKPIVLDPRTGGATG